MLLLNLTKRINKAVAPKFLSWSLKLHESIASSTSISPNVISMLPLAQRLVTLEVQDEYHKLITNKTSSSSSTSSNSWADEIWAVFFEDRHQKLKKKAAADEEIIEAEAQRLYEEKQRRRKQRRQHQHQGDAKNQKYNELVKLGEQRVEILERYVRPALLPNENENTSRSTLADCYNRHLFKCHAPDNDHVDDGQPTTVNNNDVYDNFVKWIRGEYLIAKYGPIVQNVVRQHPELKDDAAGISTAIEEIETKSNEGGGGSSPPPLVLPSVATVRESFNMKDWSRVKVPYSTWGEDDNNTPTTDNEERSTTTIDSNSNEQTQPSIEYLIHNKLHGQIANSGPLNAYFEMRRREDSYELWTREYIFGLANYLLDRIDKMNNDAAVDGDDVQTETIILDVGAGDGRLVYFIRRAMKEIVSRSNSTLSTKQTQQRADNSIIPMIIATDDGSWKAPIYSNRHIQVEQLSAIEALDKYGPKALDNQEGNLEKKKTRLIVLCSWMPPGYDWTIDFRRPLESSHDHDANDNNGSSVGVVDRLVEEYILIGEADDGTCGHNWYTWGNPDFHPQQQQLLLDDNEEANVQQAAQPPPYTVDGYTRVNLDELSLLQFSRFDCKLSSESKTVSFRQVRNK